MIAAAIGVGAATGAVITVAPLAWSMISWADQHAAEGRLLPGTVVGGVDVGGVSADAARAAVVEAIEAELADTVTFAHDDDRWATRASRLVADIDAAGAIDRALDEAEAASLVTLARARWGDPGEAIAVDVAVEPDPEAVAAAVADIADDVDQDARDATIAWGGDDAELVEHRRGTKVDRETAADALTAAVAAIDTDDLDLPVDTEPVEVTTDEVAPLVDAVATTADRTLERTVTLTAADQEWKVTAGELDAVPDTAAVLRELRQSGDAAADDATSEDDSTADADDEATAVQATGDASASAASDPREVDTAPLDISDEALAGFVDGVAVEVDRGVENAHLHYDDGWVEIAEARNGRELDRDAARERIDAALRGDADTVDLPVESTTPTRTADAFHDVLLVRRGERKLYHYVDGEIARSWSVAVGGGGSPTPTGLFHVGAKRHSPTWHNPDPDGWGEDMPEMIEPGRNNPLGLRALNWNRDGYDTLIRFHGTANVSSIGTPASQGCVRLTNPDVLELYDLVPSGTPIVSV